MLHISGVKAIKQPIRFDITFITLKDLTYRKIDSSRKSLTKNASHKWGQSNKTTHKI